MLEHLNSQRVGMPQTASNTSFARTTAAVPVHDHIDVVIATIDYWILRSAVWVVATDTAWWRLDEAVTWPKMLVVLDAVLRL